MQIGGKTPAHVRAIAKKYEEPLHAAGKMLEFVGVHYLQTTRKPKYLGNDEGEPEPLDAPKRSEDTSTVKHLGVARELHHQAHFSDIRCPHPSTSQTNSPTCTLWSLLLMKSRKLRQQEIAVRTASNPNELLSDGPTVDFPSDANSSLTCPNVGVKTIPAARFFPFSEYCPAQIQQGL